MKNIIIVLLSAIIVGYLIGTFIYENIKENTETEKQPGLLIDEQNNKIYINNKGEATDETTYKIILMAGHEILVVESGIMLHTSFCKKCIFNKQ